MPQPLERPFIPSGSAGAGTPATSTVAFHLTPPFVHGQVPSQNAEELVRPIEDFLDAGDGEIAGESNAFDYSRASVAVADDLPPIEHFTDPLPPVDGFAPEWQPPTIEASAYYESETLVEPSSAEPVQSGTEDDSGWIETEWQQFDWNAAAALGDASDPAASDEWSRTDWETSPPPRDVRETAAQAIASALDQIAERIRKGELIVPPPAAVTDPTAIAATLAALLGVRH